MMSTAIGGQKILVTGASGFVGYQIASAMTGFEVLALTGKNAAPGGLRSLSVDLADSAALRTVVEEFRPDFIVHAGAIANSLSGNSDEVFRVNLESTRELVRHAPVIFLSTDLVFEGIELGAGLISEEAQPRPLSPYGRSKASAEEVVLKERGIVVRLSLCYGPIVPVRRGFVGWVADRVQSGLEIPLFFDEFRKPTSTFDVVELVLRLVKAENHRGEIFHLPGAERISRLEFARKISEKFGWSAERFRAVSVLSIPELSARCSDIALSSYRAEQLLGRSVKNIEEGLAAIGQI